MSGKVYAHNARVLVNDVFDTSTSQVQRPNMWPSVRVDVCIDVYIASCIQYFLAAADGI